MLICTVIRKTTKLHPAICSAEERAKNCAILKNRVCSQVLDLDSQLSSAVNLYLHLQMQRVLNMQFEL
jgi:hypothetical protein